jgi:hypothetical protein
VIAERLLLIVLFFASANGGYRSMELMQVVFQLQQIQAFIRNGEKQEISVIE